MYVSNTIYCLVLLVQKLYINGVTLTVFFSNIFISVLGFWDSGISLCRIIIHSLSLLYDISFCEYNLFIQPTVDGHSSYCQFSVVTLNTFMNYGFWCIFARICIYILRAEFFGLRCMYPQLDWKMQHCFPKWLYQCQAVIHEIPLQPHLPSD